MSVQSINLLQLKPFSSQSVRVGGEFVLLEDGKVAYIKKVYNSICWCILFCTSHFYILVSCRFVLLKLISSFLSLSQCNELNNHSVHVLLSMETYSSHVCKRHCTVQSKLNCVFETDIKNRNSSKRVYQNYSVIATKEVSQDAICSDIFSAVSTEKIDGTCCYIQNYKDKPCLWARLDRKPKKSAEKMFKKYSKDYQYWNINGEQGLKPRFVWKYPDDMKSVPEMWIPADRVSRDSESNCIVPDANGHIPGWVPISVDQRQYCWHNAVIHEQSGLVLILQQSVINNSSQDTHNIKVYLELCVQRLGDLVGRTFELIGTNINGNPYSIGSKDHPFHVLVEHGNITITGHKPNVDFDEIRNWLQSNESPNGNVEGIVWHCSNGKMFKIHRHHLGLSWPISPKTSDRSGEPAVEYPYLCCRPIWINGSSLRDVDDLNFSNNSQFLQIKRLHSKTFSSIRDIPLAFATKLNDVE